MIRARSNVHFSALEMYLCLCGQSNNYWLKLALFFFGANAWGNPHGIFRQVGRSQKPTSCLQHQWSSHLFLLLLLLPLGPPWIGSCLNSSLHNWLSFIWVWFPPVICRLTSVTRNICTNFTAGCLSWLSKDIPIRNFIHACVLFFGLEVNLFPTAVNDGYERFYDTHETAIWFYWLNLQSWWLNWTNHSNSLNQLVVRPMTVGSGLSWSAVAWILPSCSWGAIFQHLWVGRGG